MKATEIKVGQKVEFTLTGKIFEIAKVTEKRISWYTGFTCLSSWGKNKQSMAWDSIKGFQKGIDSGEYKLL